jgi:hypothetical protein
MCNLSIEILLILGEGNSVCQHLTSVYSLFLEYDHWQRYMLVLRWSKQQIKVTVFVEYLLILVHHL